MKDGFKKLFTEDCALDDMEKNEVRRQNLSEIIRKQETWKLFAFLHVEITHDDDQTDVIYMLLMSEPSNYDIES